MPIAIVTGTSRGLGEALACGLAEAGWSLVVDARDLEALRASEVRIRALLASGASLLVLGGDVTDQGHREALVEAARSLGGLDLLVNNAGALGPSPLPRLACYPLDELLALFEVNVLAPLALVQQALPLLRASPDPRVINLTSDASIEAYEGWGGYGSTKAALDQLSAVFAAEEPGIRVWAVDPGDMATRMHQEAFPGEDISDRPAPESVVPGLLALIDARAPSGRYRVAELATTDGTGPR